MMTSDPIDTLSNIALARFATPSKP